MKNGTFKSVCLSGRDFFMSGFSRTRTVQALNFVEDGPRTGLGIFDGLWLP